MIRVLALAVAVFWTSASFAYDYCQEGTERVAVLVDQTTRYDDQDRTVITQGLEKILKGLNPGTLLTIQTIVDSAADSKLVFSGCVPGCREGGITNWVESSCSSIRAKKDNWTYLGNVVSAIKPLLTDKVEYPRSEIVRTVRGASGKIQDRHPTKLLVYSDLLENSEILPYRTKGYFLDAPAAKKKIQQLGLLADLNSADVTVFGFGRNHTNKVFGDYESGRSGLDPVLEKSVVDFWNWYFNESGAKKVDINTSYSQ